MVYVVLLFEVGASISFEVADDEGVGKMIVVFFH